MLVLLLLVLVLLLLLVLLLVGVPPLIFQLDCTCRSGARGGGRLVKWDRLIRGGKLVSLSETAIVVRGGRFVVHGGRKASRFRRSGSCRRGRCQICAIKINRHRRAGSGSCHQGKCRQGVFWVAPLRQVSSRQFVVPFVAGEAIT